MNMNNSKHWQNKRGAELNINIKQQVPDQLSQQKEDCTAITHWEATCIITLLLNSWNSGLKVIKTRCSQMK